MVKPLQGKRAVVTGAASGIGRAIAEAFADQGCALTLNGFGDPDDINAVATFTAAFFVTFAWIQLLAVVLLALFGLPVAALALGYSAVELGRRAEATEFAGYPLHFGALWIPALLASAVLLMSEAKVTAEDLKAYMLESVTQGKLPKYGVPDRYEFVEALPKTSVGKLDKKVLREQYH